MHSLNQTQVGMIVPLLEWMTNITIVAIWTNVLTIIYSQAGALFAGNSHQELAASTKLEAEERTICRQGRMKKSIISLG